MSAIALPAPRIDRTSDEAVRRADVRRPNRPLAVPIAVFVGACVRESWLETKFGRDLVRDATRVASREASTGPR